MVDAMWRQQRELLDVASDDARLKLRQWELPEALQVHCWNIRSCRRLQTLGTELICCATVVTPYSLSDLVYAHLQS